MEKTNIKDDECSDDEIQVILERLCENNDSAAVPHNTLNQDEVNKKTTLLATDDNYNTVEGNSIHAIDENNQVLDSSEEEFVVHIDHNNNIVDVVNNENKKELTKKRIRNPEKWKVNERKSKHQAGQEYVNHRNKKIPKKEIQTKKDCLEKCRFKCARKITNQERESFFNEFYQLDHNRKHDFILKLTKRTETMRKTKNDGKSRRCFTFNYFLIVNGFLIQVCKNFWLGTFSISQTPVYTAHLNKCQITGTAKKDQRGKFGSKKLQSNRIEEVISHVNSFPCVDSHYCRAKTTKKFIEPNLNVTKMHELYAQKYVNPVKISYYRTIFNTKFNYSFHQPKTDLCGTCEVHRVAQSKNILTENCIENYSMHQQLKSSMREHKQKDRESDTPVLTFDLQNVITCPRSQIGPIFYYSKLNIYNLTAQLSTTKKTYCALWTEYTAGRSGNDLASAFIKILNRVLEDNQDIQELITWSDSCVPQNRNSYISTAIKCFLKSNPLVHSITLKYSIAGHSACQEVDKIHSDIEKVLAVNEFFSPMGLIKILKTVNRRNPLVIIQMQPNDFKDYEMFSKLKYDFKKVPFYSLHMIKFTKEEFEVQFCEDYEVKNLKVINIRRSEKCLKKNELNLSCEEPDIQRTKGNLSQGKKKHLMEIYMKDVDIEYYKCILKLECLCNPVGSLTQICDRRTGQCLCHPNVSGKRCERCEIGFWNLSAGLGCRDCNCNNIGSLNDECDLWAGQCSCKKGVGGRHCDQCLEGFYGFSNLGCKLCEVCQSPGHVCDPETGRCVCPPNSKGFDCLQCHQGTWGWKSKIGCQRCNCDMIGSIGQTCEIQTGQCICREGYTGRRCDICRIGYFGYPNCRRCNCNSDGSLIRDDGIIECDQDGKCNCKELVGGIKCDTCLESTFGLAENNPAGCTKCFCFGRSQYCHQSELSWGHIRMPIARNLSVHYVNPTSVPSRDYEYIVVVLLEGTNMFQEDAEIGQMNGLNLVPSSVGNVTIGAYTWFYYPLYFQLPPQFYGDKTSSYGGYLRFNITTEGAKTHIDKNILTEYPLVQIHSHGRLVLDYYRTNWVNIELNETYIIPLHESYWKFHHNRQDVSRAVMMTALQNIRHIFLRASSWSDFSSVVLCNVHMDSAIYLAGSRNIIANGIESCSCSPQYDGYSCQDPGKGYYRWKNTTETTEIFFLEDLIGWSIPCNCNGRSEECDAETGICLNCKNNTGGDSCERCAEGYYGDPNYNKCESCPCPETSRNFARGCNVFMGEVSCICKPGYTGARCDHCRPGFYGNPHEINGTCKSCDCNLNGIISDQCDPMTGQCDCRPGVSGRRCDICFAERHYLSEDKDCKICDNCTIILLDYVESISNKLRRGIAHMDLTGIPAPWLNLQEYDSQMQNIRSHLHNFTKTRQEMENFDIATLEKLLAHSENTKIRWRKLNVTAAKKSLAVNQQRLDANQIYLEATGVIRQDILKTIFELNNYGNHEHHISLPLALEQARYFLNEIKYHQDTTNTMREAWKCAWNDYYFYGNASDTVFDQKGMLEIFWRKINQFHHRMGDLGRYTDKTLDMVNEADDIKTHVVSLQSYLHDTYGQANEMTDYIKQLLDSDLMPRANVMIDMVDGGGEQIDINIKNMENIRGIWNESWNVENNLRRDLKKHWLPKAWRHAKRLMERSNDYAKQFQPTKDGARVAILASSAHKNISKAIDAARYASIESKEAVMISLDKLYPKGGKSVVEKAHQSLERSKILNENAKHEMNKTDVLKINVKLHEDKVETIKSTIWDAGYKLNNVSSSMAVINGKETMSSVWESIDAMTTVSDEMREQKQRTSEMKSNIQKLRHKLTALEPEWDSKLSLAEENISETLSNIRKAKISLNEIEIVQHKEHKKFEMWNETMSRQLQELKDKIAKARHAAEGIKISLESLAPKCVRSYIPQTLGLSTSNTIKISIALNNSKGHSPLIFMQGRERKFIALEMFRRKIRLLWNIGGGTTTVTHPLEIQSRDPKHDDAWYHIEANRTLNYGSLLVRRMTNSGILNESYAVTGNSHSEYTRFIRTKSDRIWLGGVPKELNHKELLAPPGLNIVMHQVYVDFKPLGIWNFAHSEGICGGAVSGATETGATSNARHFDGNGYSVMDNTRFRLHRDNVFELQLTFKSMDENSLLFLAVDVQTNRTISVKLKEGKVIFEVQYGDDNKMVISSKEKHNTGKWTKVEAAREFNRNRRAEMGILRIDQQKSIKGSPGIRIESSEIPDVSTASYHVGGIPPGFPLELIELDGSNQNSFLGCIMDIIINRDSYDPLQGSEYFGIEPSCKPTSNKVGFYGNGFIELQSQSLKKKANVAFVFRTLQPDSLLLLSAHPPNSSQKIEYANELLGNYSISLIDGRIHVWINTGISSIKLQSNTTLNDGEYHVINLIKFGRRIELIIDDEFHTSQIFAVTPTIVNMSKENGGLYIGGAPDIPEYKNLAPTFVGLQGSFRDLIFNNKTVLLGEAISFKNVQIGRTGPEMGSINNMNDILMKTEPIEKIISPVSEVAQGCFKVDNFAYEENAYKYGDHQYSYSQHSIPTKHFWQKNFQITFDLRTFYPNGILLLSPGSKEKQKHYVSLLLKDGHLNLIVRGRRKEEIPLTAKLNNGEWHRVSVNCQERKITMSVEIGGTDQKTSVQMKIPKKISAINTIFVGGLPEKSIGLPSELLVKTEGFKGCIRKLEINNSTQDLTKDKKHMNIGKCFRNVEKGSHFSGNAYVIYKKNFHVGKYLEFELDFRTSVMDGILMSVSEPDGFPAISLEIYQGNVVLSCDLGDGNPFRVETYLSSKYSICDNRWHNISALYDFEQIALRIDNQPPTVSVAQHRVSGKVQTKSPLFIGGLPEHAPSGTLLSRENFRGCIRNIAIRNERKDWIDMDSLHNVQLSECLSL